MKILTVSSCVLDPKLGSGKTRLRWSEGLRALGHTVDVLQPRDYESFPDMQRARRFRQAIGASRVVPRKAKTTAYDLIDFCGGEFGLVTWLLARMPKRPLLVAHTDGLELLASERERAYDRPSTLRDHLRQSFARLTHDRLSHAAFAYADIFITLCELDRRYILDHGLFPQERTAVIAPGLDGEYLDRPFVTEKEHRIAYTGSWIPRKGVSRLAEVVSRVLRQDTAVSFDVYGAKDRSAVLASFPESLHHRVTVHGSLSNQELAAGMSRAKVFFFPSQYEGFGMAIAEAMACSCAVVTTPTGFGGDLTDGVDAFLCGFEESTAMEAAIAKLLRDDGLRSTIARNGWQRTQELRWDANVKKLEAFYLRWSEPQNGSRSS
jgi:glycosyltransferase involved in cell wall biosynthesis